MTSPKALKLTGFYRLRPDQPGFAIAVFADTNGLWVQQTHGGKIIGFTRCGIHEKEIIRVTDSKQKIIFHRNGKILKELPSQRVGLKKIYAFRRPDGVIEAGKRTDLIYVLSELASKLEDQPFVMREVSNFTFDKTIRRKADSLIAPLLLRKPIEVNAIDKDKPLKANSGRVVTREQNYDIDGLFLGNKFIRTRELNIGDRVVVRVKIIEHQRNTDIKLNDRFQRISTRTSSRDNVLTGIVVYQGKKDGVGKCGRVRFSTTKEMALVRSAIKVFTSKDGNPRHFEVVARTGKSTSQLGFKRGYRKSFESDERNVRVRF